MTNISRTLLGVALTLAAGVAQAQGTSIPVGPRPESVTSAWGGKYYVSIQGAPALGLNDGEIRTVDIDTGVVAAFVTGLDNPRGLAFTGRHLVVTDTTTVWIIDEAGTKRVLADDSAFPHPIAFLNDAAPEHGGRAVYVTEMGARTMMRDPAGILWPTDSPQGWAIPATSRVYRITLEGQVTEVVSPSRKLLVMNGVATSRRGGRLLAVDFFHGNVVELKLGSGDKQIIATGFRGADGVEQDRRGNIFVSSFENGAVWKMDADGENLQVLIEGVGRQSTADFALDERRGVLVVADTVHGTVLVLPTE